MLLHVANPFENAKLGNREMGEGIGLSSHLQRTVYVIK